MCAFSEETGERELFEQLLAAVHHSKVKYTWLQSTIGSNTSNSRRESSGQCWVTVNEKDGSVAERLHSLSLDTELDDDNSPGDIH